VDRAGREVKQCERDLLKAEAKGDAHKIERRKADLAKAQKQWEDAQRKLLDAFK
jgi:hypothetical protein